MNDAVLYEVRDRIAIIADTIRRCRSMTLDDSVRLMEESVRRPDFREGVASFVERRPPNFRPVGGDRVRRRGPST